MQRLRRDQQGFTLVEMMVALVVAAIFFTATAFTLASVLKGTSQTRDTQQSIDVISTQIEALRDLDYDALVMRYASGQVPSTAPNAQAITGPTSGKYWFDPDGAGPGATESLYWTNMPAGAPTPFPPVAPYQEITQNGVVYKVRTYVTVPAASVATSDPYKRITVKLTWKINGATYTKANSTYIAKTVRGLPLPSFTVGTGTTYTVERGARLVVAFKITNNGARDSWNLTTETTPFRSWDFDWFIDDDKDGSWDFTETTKLTDDYGGSDSGSAPETRTIETDETRYVIGVADIPNGASQMGTISLKINAQSKAQPAVPSKSMTHSVTVTNSSCGGCTFERVFLHNVSTSDDEFIDADGPSTVLQPIMLANSGLPGVDGSLPDYDTDRGNAFPGRVLNASAIGTSHQGPPFAPANQLAIWEYQAPQAYTLAKGKDTTVSLYLGSATGSAESVNVGVYLYVPGSTSAWAGGSASVSVPATGFQGMAFSFSMPNTDKPILNTQKVQIRVVANKDVVLAFDELTTYPALLEIPTTWPVV